MNYPLQISRATHCKACASRVCLHECECNRCQTLYTEHITIFKTWLQEFWLRSYQLKKHDDIVMLPMFVVGEKWFPRLKKNQPTNIPCGSLIIKVSQIYDEDLITSFCEAVMQHRLKRNIYVYLHTIDAKYYNIGLIPDKNENKHATTPKIWLSGKTSAERYAITAICGLFMDIDNETIDPNLINKDNIITNGVHYPPPSTLVRTGTGYHLYWRFRDQLDNTDENRHRVQTLKIKLYESLATSLQVDMNTKKNWSLVGRVPATLNHMYKIPALTEWIRFK